MARLSFLWPVPLEPATIFRFSLAEMQIKTNLWTLKNHTWRQSEDFNPSSSVCPLWLVKHTAWWPAISHESYRTLLLTAPRGRIPPLPHRCRRQWQPQKHLWCRKSSILNNVSRKSSIATHKSSKRFEVSRFRSFIKP